VVTVTAAGWLVGGAVIACQGRRSGDAGEMSAKSSTGATSASGADGTTRRPGGVRPSALGLLAVLSAPLLAGSWAAPTEWDSRAIWFFHARWFWSGGEQARAAIGNPALAYAHADYPPLVPGSTAGLWSLWNGGDMRLAQAVTSIQTWLAVVLAGVVIIGLVRRRAQLPTAVLAALFAVACFGAAGGFGTRGYADLLWAGFAVAGALAAFIHPVRRDAVGLAAVCFAAAMLTKGEGLVTVALLFLPLASLRWLLVARHRALPWVFGLVLAGAAGVSWPLVSRAHITVTQRDISAEGVRALLAGRADKIDRLGPALRGLWGYSRITIVTAGLLIVAGLLLHNPPVRALRRQLHLGGGLWLPVLAAGCFVAFTVVLGAGELDVHWWVVSGG
jgi:hypothetical protein